MLLRHLASTPTHRSSMGVDRLELYQEKSIQVGAMGMIYAAAATVLACIRAHADDSGLVFSMAPEDDHS